ncbi:MAG TPA: alpha/beta fold hydrolase [Steroidobacteraceae bacterium]|jgi:pimeloyl-ACP methyl ester carboxylesterase|nr:alpha/beta fold hydrolase [Steroidobacteraceae bacterium]
MKELLIRLVVGLAVIVVVVLALTWVAGDDLTKPTNRDITIGRPPLDLEASNITFASGSGSLIHGWLSPGKPGHGAVILLHGLRGDRREMLSRAEFLRARGYSVLLFDFQGHGESRGSLITFGDLESRDVTAAIQYLHHKLPNEQVGVIGVSLGAAAFVLAEERPAVAAVVLEQMYPTIQQAVAGRARKYLGPVAPVLAPLLMVQVQARLKIPANRLRPIDRMGQIGAPVLIVNGTQDSYTSIEDARALFAAASNPKELWAVEGAGHVNLHAFAKAQYEQRVGDFLGRYMAAKAQ